MPTNWFYPSVVTQFAEADVHVPWMKVDEEFTQINFVRTTVDLKHLSNPLVNDIRMKTYFLKITGFNWEDLPETINGIEASIDIRRIGRVTDETISLCINGQPVGDNVGNADLSNIKTYGGNGMFWGLPSLDVASVDENFGLILRYQSHPHWCHQSTPNMNHIQMRFW
jgi:hypothetical protein